MNDFTASTEPCAAECPVCHSGHSGVFDEMVESGGRLRPHWQKFDIWLNHLGHEELTVRWENARRIIREHGITYNVHGDPQGMSRPWELDLAPLIISASEWQQLESAILQRAVLFNHILADLYDFQWHLRDGFFPPALVYNNPAYLRPCHGMKVPRGMFMPFYAADLARSADGQWWVLADRTQSLLGAGYALENRTVLSRVIPEVLRDCGVRPLGAFFRAERDALRSLAPRNQDNPNIVLLSPGPHSAAYFEHAFLARHLGFPLVEGGDLTVRDSRVFIKTLEGLQPVDVIVRRVDDAFCDPLELRDDSFLGVSGLVQAARAGNVALANPLGSGLLESPAFMAFLPTLCRHVMGAELALPSVATWWCGQPRERAYVFERLDQLIIKPAFGSPSQKSFIPAEMSRRERAALEQALKARPHDFVAQELVRPSHAPVLVNQHCESRPVVMRIFAVAGPQEGQFVVLPGGLTRVPNSLNDDPVAMHQGGGSKDTWVLADAPLPLSSSPAVLTGAEVAEKTFSGLPSRVADNLFWLGRYTERLENLLRVLRSMANRLTAESSGETRTGQSCFARFLAGYHLVPTELAGNTPGHALTNEVLRLIYDPETPAGVKPLLQHIQTTAWIVRDRFSADTWRILARLQMDAKPRPGRLPLVNAQAQLDTLILGLAALSGMEMENMTRGHGWRFLDFGRRLERGVHLVRLLRAALAPELPLPPMLELLLAISDSSMTYRRRYYAEAQLPGVLHLLLSDETNPRSLAFQLEALRDHCANLPHETEHGTAGSELTRLAQLRSAIATVDFRPLAHARQEAMMAPLEALLTNWASQLSGVSDQLTHHYFSHTQSLSSSG
ncbi:MAG: circularly permuted type 2 ATP-grasp protein [Verrucomicrobiota bacterium]